MKFNKGHIKSAKLTPSQVWEIKELYLKGASQGALSRQFYVSIGTIGRIVRGESWQAFGSPEDTEMEKIVGDAAETIPPDPEEIRRSQERLKKLLEGDSE